MARTKSDREDHEPAWEQGRTAQPENLFTDSTAGIGRLAEEQSEELLEEIQLALDDIRPQLVAEALTLVRVLRGAALAAEEGETDDEWAPIGSLSQLRAVVGGRYSNLKSKWTEAGFPLRAYRGDREAEAEIDAAGWGQLVDWIQVQGFEARLTPGSPRGLFEVRKT